MFVMRFINDSVNNRAKFSMVFGRSQAFCYMERGSIQ